MHNSKFDVLSGGLFFFYHNFVAVPTLFFMLSFLQQIGGDVKPCSINQSINQSINYLILSSVSVLFLFTVHYLLDILNFVICNLCANISA